VLYDGEVCLGGAIIATTDAPLEQQARNRAA
jgi:tRNA-specific 2-thiouridylase